METYRNWRKLLTPLQRPSAPRNCYSAGDVLAMAVIHTMTKDFSIRIGALTTVAEGLFKTCNDHSWLALERSKVVILPGEGTIEFHADEAPVHFRESALVVVLRPLIERIHEALLAGQAAGEQGMFPFRPAALSVSDQALQRRRQS